MTNEMDEMVNYSEFIQLAGLNKISLIDQLASRMLVIGYEAAAATAEHYRIKLTAKDDPKLPEATAKRAKLEGEYDALKHAVSALQSTLRAERELSE
jgi:ribonucleotide monophosphatase NagD (HAD superfamily)